MSFGANSSLLGPILGLMEPVFVGCPFSFYFGFLELKQEEQLCLVGCPSCGGNILVGLPLLCSGPLEQKQKEKLFWVGLLCSCGTREGGEPDQSNLRT